MNHQPHRSEGIPFSKHGKLGKCQVFITTEACSPEGIRVFFIREIIPFKKALLFRLVKYLIIYPDI
jgi:hypothetical protein